MPQAVIGGARHCCLSSRLQPALPTSTCSPLTVRSCLQCACPAFISRRLDYCNSLLYCVSDRLLRRLQSVQNAAARTVTDARRCEHISSLLRQLHWLQIRQLVTFKVLRLVHESLAGVAPAYLADDCPLLSDVSRRNLRSSSNDFRLLVVRQTNNKFGDRSFSAAGLRLWNDLPHHITVRPRCL